MQRPFLSLLTDKSLLLVFMLAGLAACGDAKQSSGTSPDTTGTRWYTESQRLAGAEVFAENCAVCHGEQAQGLVADWRQKLDDGSFPPPPLNGSAHAWHHPLALLLQVVNVGGAQFGGKMPAFETVLSEENKLAAIAFFQGFWSDETYNQWMQMGGTN
jgi:mono/diheme cytochrome c family protein